MEPKGSGKAPLVELLIGRTAPTLGTLRLAGLDPRQDKEQFSQQVGVLFAQDSLYQRQSPRGNLNFYCRLRKSQAEEALTLVGLADQTNARLDKLAPGLARRLAFGCAILHQSSVLLLIELFNKCDQATISLLGRLIHQQAENGVAVLILADDDAHLAALCDAAIHVLRQSRIVESYQPGTLCRQAASGRKLA